MKDQIVTLNERQMHVIAYLISNAIRYAKKPNWIVELEKLQQHLGTVGLAQYIQEREPKA